VFAAPTPGMSPPQRWLNKCSLAAEHVAAGDFASAMGLLNRSANFYAAHMTSANCHSCHELAHAHAAFAPTDQHLRSSFLPPASRRQLGIVEFGPLKPYFLEVHGGAVAALPTLPGELPLTAHLDRGWSSDGGSAPPTQPALVRRLTVAVMSQSLRGASVSPGWAAIHNGQAPALAWC